MDTGQIITAAVTITLAVVGALFKIWKRARDQSAQRELSILTDTHQRDGESWARLERRLDDQDELISELKAENKTQREEIDGLYLRVYDASEKVTTARNMLEGIKTKYEILEARYNASEHDRKTVRAELRKCRDSEFALRTELQSAKFVLTYLARRMGVLPDDIQRMLARMDDCEPGDL